MKFWKKQPDESFTWEPAATQALDAALDQTPVPAMLRGQVRHQLERAAEAVTRSAGRTAVTPADLMQGLMNSMPANVRQQIEEATKDGPEGLKKLQDELSQDSSG